MLEKYVPHLWKRANICPIPKSSPPRLDALRPISLLATPSKILEKIVLDSIKPLFLEHIDKYQFGYLPLSSTTCALIHLLDRITAILEEDDAMGVAVLSLDYSKAFDTITHSTLINKLHLFNFPPGFIAWISSYLYNRTQRTVIGNFMSQPVPITSGVPQGSILGPYLFIFYTAEITDGLGSNYMKYADDTSLLAKITANIHGSETSVRQTFDSIKEKSESANLHLNVSKSKLLICSKSSNCPTITIPGVENVSSLKLLGLTITNNIKWDTHIQDLLSKCSRRLYALRILKPICNNQQLSTVFTSLICSVLEYACPVFVSLPQKLTSDVDRFLRRCHIMIHGSDCTCDIPANYAQMRLTRAVHLFKQAEASRIHPLHNLVPAKLPRSGQYYISYCKTARRQETFFNHMAFVLNSTR